MNTKPITESEYAPLRVSALPSRPTASSAFGGRGYTASQLKEAFDRLPLLLIERFNSLLADLAGTGKGSLVSTIPTGLESNHTLALFFEDVKNGMLATYLSVEGEPLTDRIHEITSALEKAEKLCADAESGALADTLTVNGEPLSAVIAALAVSIEKAEKLCADAESGALADTLTVNGEPLSAVIAALKEAPETDAGGADRTLDGGHPKDRI